MQLVKKGTAVMEENFGSAAENKIRVGTTQETASVRDTYAHRDITSDV